MSDKKSRQKVGLVPGSLIYTGTGDRREILFTAISYSSTSFEVKNFNNVTELIGYVEKSNGNVWINIDGLSDVDSIERLCNFLEIHKLTIEDILNVNQRPKLEQQEDYIHLVMKMLIPNQESSRIEVEQVSFILKGRLLISFQEKNGDVFEHVRKRIYENTGYVRKMNTDYLLYSLVDAIVDYYFLVLEKTGERLDEVENRLLSSHSQNILAEIHMIRKDIVAFRRFIYPVREVVSQLERVEDEKISSDLKLFIRDLYDHTIRVIEATESFRDTSASLIDLYMNNASNKMNQIMKTLTIISTIFIPLTFIAGIYGMNFENMPELKMKSGYFIILGVMAVVPIVMIAFFKRKKWF
ncbi:MAG: magnesium/cobalt transporter CorA [Spirochaetales bacterium]|nr:magnesium/cobalt transporter CorA [Spirochaetales bacterium]